MRTRCSPLGLVRSILISAMCGSSLANVALAQCDPAGNWPPTGAGLGCAWWIWDESYTDRTVITGSTDSQLFSVWEKLPPCACGWYGPPLVCPNCPPSPEVHTLTDTFTWTTSSTVSAQIALNLKARLIVEVGYSGSLTATEQQELSGTHTETTQTTLWRTAVMCFTRYYRQTWGRHYRAGATYRDWTYTWIALGPVGYQCTAGMPTTKCTDTIASGNVTWDTYPNYEWAPQEPPCGGVAVTKPDPWGGTRETPCCATVCTPPPPNEHPGCGCAG